MLNIIITHYKESDETMKPLLDSIALQQGIDFSQLKVCIANDGDNLPSKEFIESFPFPIEVYHFPHKGISATRNGGIDKCTEEYLMFCDCDDMFLNNYGLHLVFSAMQEGFDILTSIFVEELKLDNGMKLVRHDKDKTFVHGKVFRKAYLDEKNIRFKEELTVHEDGYFVCLAYLCAETRKNIETPFYLWKWNDNSVVRKDTDAFLIKTYPNLMDARMASIEQYFIRGYTTGAVDAVAKTVLDSYYDFNKAEWLDPKNAKEVKKAEKAFKRFYDVYKQIYKECPKPRLAELMVVARNNAYNNGFRVENWTLNGWLNHIVREV